MCERLFKDSMTFLRDFGRMFESTTNLLLLGHGGISGVELSEGKRRVGDDYREKDDRVVCEP